MWISSRIAVVVSCVLWEARNTDHCFLHSPPFSPPFFIFPFILSSFLFSFIFQNWKLRSSKARMFKMEPGPQAVQRIIFLETISVFIKNPRGSHERGLQRKLLKILPPAVTPSVDEYKPLPNLLMVSIESIVAILLVNSKQDTSDNDKCVNSGARRWKNIFMHYFILHWTPGK